MHFCSCILNFLDDRDCLTEKLRDSSCAADHLLMLFSTVSFLVYIELQERTIVQVCPRGLTMRWESLPQCSNGSAEELAPGRKRLQTPALLQPSSCHLHFERASS